MIAKIILARWIGINKPNGVCGFIRHAYASSFEGNKANTQYDRSGNGQDQNQRNDHYQKDGYGDQKAYYTAHKRQVYRLGGDRQFNNNRNVTGFGGRQYQRQGDAGGTLKPVDYSRKTLEPIVKDLYRENAAIGNRNQAEVNQWLAENECTLQGKNVPRPIFEFSESTFPQLIIDKLYKNYQHPTVIQSISWPVALSGRDMISIAKTGTGKTLAFILPAIVHTMSQPARSHGEGPTVLVMLPTRELALQVAEVALEFCKVTGLHLTCCYGGASKLGQANDLHRGVDIVIATPGRILDFLESGDTNMHRCSFLVLDEADRMLDMGFEPQIRKIVGQIRPDRQSLMFSATWPEEVRALASDFQNDPVQLNVGSLELAANHNITQKVEVVDESDKQRRLMELLENIMSQSECKTLIFVQTKSNADYLTRIVRRAGFSALCTHGDKSQNERKWVLGEFKDGKTSILIATDVAARGLDVSDIKFVINYDYPNTTEDYVHRIGRTGRQDKTGTSYTFFTPQNANNARDLIKVLEEAKQDVPDSLRGFIKDTYDTNNGAKRQWRQHGRSGGSFFRRSEDSWISNNNKKFSNSW